MKWLYYSGYICHVIFLSIDFIKNILFQSTIWHIWSLWKTCFSFQHNGPTAYWSYSKLPPKTPLYCYSTRTNYLYHMICHILELDKQMIDINFWVEKRKMKRRTPHGAKSLKCFNHVSCLYFSKCFKKLIDLLSFENHCFTKSIFFSG